MTDSAAVLVPPDPNLNFQKHLDVFEFINSHVTRRSADLVSRFRPSRARRKIDDPNYSSRWRMMDVG